MKDNLGLVGLEIINSNSNVDNISSHTSGKVQQKIITKSYNIINTPKKNIKYIEKKSSETKKGNALDLSKIMYNDGVILTDAVNSNPGFGLWAIKGSSHNETDRTINTTTNNRTKTNKTLSSNRLLINENKVKNDNINNRYNLTRRTNKQTTNNISTINNTSVSKNTGTNNKINSLNISNETAKQEKNKKIIDLLTMKCNDLEQKCINMISNYTQKENLCKDALKVKNEFEKILKENIEETKSIKEEYKRISQDNAKLKNVFKNTKNEVDRLLNVMKSDKNIINNIKEEFENRLRNEEIERERLNNILDKNEKYIETLGREKEKTNEIINKRNPTKKRNSTIINIITNKNSSKKEDFEIDNLNNIILELEIKISNLKKKIVKSDEENEQLRNILRFKEQKDEIEKNNFTNLYNLLEYQNKNRQNELNTINEQNNIIKNLKNNIDFKRKKNRLTKSMSLRNDKFRRKLEYQ